MAQRPRAHWAWLASGALPIAAGCNGLLGIQELSGDDGGMADGRAGDDVASGDGAWQGDVTAGADGAWLGDVMAQSDDGRSAPDSQDAGPEQGAPNDTPPEAPIGNIVYVSPAGDDANDGTDRTKPKKTIASGLTRAKSISTGPEVHVCEGTYSETSLSVSQTLNLRGSYDCTSWQQTSTYGFPTFDKVNLSVIENANPSLQAATLLVTGAVAPSAVVDGFAIVGASSFAGTTYGVEVTGAASPVLANDTIAGGAGTGASGKPGSVGVSIEGGSPEVRSSQIAGGGGTGSPGSIAIDIASTGAPYVHDLVASGGTGTPVLVSDPAAIGIRVATPMYQANALANLLVAGSDPMATGGSTVGIRVVGTGLAVDILSSAIDGGTGTGGNTTSVGVDVTDASGSVRLSGNRIYGGTRGGGGAAYGVFASGAGSLEVQNSEIHAGTTSGSAIGIDVVAAGASQLVFSTIYAGASGGSAIAIESGVKGVVVEDDLLLGANSATVAAVTLRGCSGGQLGALDHTAFVNFNVLYACDTTTAVSIPQMASMLPGVQTTGDIEIASGAACTTASSCVSDPSCPGGSGVCLPSILGASFTAADDGITGLLRGAPAPRVDGGAAEAGSVDGGTSLQGWTLPAGTLCAIARGGAPIGGIKADLFGQARDPNKPTIGAVEYMLTTCN
jgi:hypothetical protein